MTSLHRINQNLTCFRILTCFLLCLGLTGCDAETQRALEAAFSTADGAVSNLAAAEDARVINGEFDYGFNITFTVRNVGDSGIITVSPWLSSSEGEWSRVQKLNFRAGESMNLTYFFHEPTVNATSVQYGVNVSP